MYSQRLVRLVPVRVGKETVTVLLAAMADMHRELKVSTLEAGVLTVQVMATNTIQELTTMLREKKHEDPIERKILKAEVLVGGSLVQSDSQTLEAAGAVGC